MRYKYLLIQSKINIYNHLPIIENVLSTFLSVDKIVTDDCSIIFYFNHDLEDSVQDVIDNLVEDIYIDLRAYESRKYKTTEELEMELTLIKRYLNDIPFHVYRYINNQIILEENLLKITEELIKISLGEFYNDIEMLKTIKTYLEYNQNMSNAAKLLYLHRNTLNQRLDKFYYETEFNVKLFKDAFLIYHLLK